MQDVRIKVIIFGATKRSIEILRNEMHQENIEVVAFSDNDKDKWGVVIDNAPIIRPEKVVDYAYDYVLISAWHSFDEVKKQLVLYGVEESKIDFLYVRGISYLYGRGTVNINDDEVLHKLYLYSDMILEEVQSHVYMEQLWTDYNAWQPVNRDCDEDNWSCKGTMIAHACGGIVKGIKRMYSNSKEALQYSLKKGFQLIECDAWGVIGGEVVLAHEAADLYDGHQGAYSLLTIRDMLHEIENYPDVHILVDIKWEKPEEYKKIVDVIDSLANEKQKRQIILEVYDEPTIIYAVKKQYQCFYTQYRNSDWRYFIKTAVLCCKYGIGAVGFSIETALSSFGNYFNIFTDKNIRIFVYSTDSVDQYAKLRKRGVSGVFTNYLVENRAENER